MRRAVYVALARAAAAGAVAAVVAAARPGDRALVLDVYLLFVGGLALLLFVRAVRAAIPAGTRSDFERALRLGSAPARRPEALTALEREVLLSSKTAFYLHYRIRPVLREIAAYGLSSRRGIDLDAEPEAARTVLGPEAWELVRPDREAPADRLGPGRPVTELRAAVDALERI